MTNDGIYGHTRRRGKRGVVTVVGETTGDPKTLTSTTEETQYPIRWLVKQKTQYSRVYGAQQINQRIGVVTFVIWLPDVKRFFTELDEEDYIHWNNDGKRYDVVTSDVEDNGLVITANEVSRGKS